LKGFVFSLDAILALGMTLAVIGILGVYYTIEPQLKYTTMHSEAEDSMQILSNRVNATELNLPDEFDGKSALDVIGTLWLEGNKTDAGNLTEKLLKNFTSRCFELVFGDDIIYKSCPTEGNTIAVSNRMVSGYMAGEKPKGYTSRIFIKKLRNFKSKFLYFGGYVGDGNITKVFNITHMDSVLSVDMEVVPGSDFELYINNNYAGRYNSSKSFMRSDNYTICNLTFNPTYCGYFQDTNNSIEFRFLGNESYIGGGHIKIKYNTTEFSSEEDYGRYQFPGIRGIINLYDSFYIPGTLNSMNIYLHYNSTYPLFLRIGNATVFDNESYGEGITNITNNEIENNLTASGLSFSFISNKTVPIRFGFRNVSYVEYQTGQEADVFSVTDLSGSMGKDHGGCDVPFNCSDPRICSGENYYCENYSIPSCSGPHCEGADCSQWCCNQGGAFGDCCDSSYSNCNACGGTWSCILGIFCWCSGGSCTNHQDCCNTDCCDNGESDCEDCDGTWVSQDACDDPETYCNSSQSLCEEWCNGTWSPHSCNIERIEMAKDANKIFIDDVLNRTGNKIGLVGYETDVNNDNCHDLSDNKTSLKSKVDEWGADGWTCICCGINEAVDRLLAQSSDDRFKSIVVMSDGEANVECTPYNICNGDEACIERAKQDAIDAACDAYQNHNITVYTIGFGSDAENQTLQDIANCGGGEYYFSNVSELADIYKQIAEKILNASYVAQTVKVYGGMGSFTELYPDSYIKFNYTSQVYPPEYGEISFDIETPRFGGDVESPKNSSFIIPPEGRIVDAKVTSYSSQYWTDRGLIYNGTSWNYFFKLWDYGNDYQKLGDPHIIHIPVRELHVGINNVSIDTGTISNTTGGSPDDSVIYTIAIRGFTDYGGVFKKYEGCSKEIFYDLDQDGMADGSETIVIGNGSDVFDPDNDALDDALTKLLDNLNFIDDTGDNDGEQTNPVDILPTEFEFDSVASGGIPWTWGPSIFTLKVW